MAVLVANTPLGEWLSARIQSSGNTQNAVALYCGVSNSAISEWARGKRIPDPPYCWKLADYFKVETEYVMRLAGHLPPVQDEPDPPPPWLANLIAELRQVDLTPREADVLDATVQGLLALREERALYEAQEPPAPEDPA